MLYLNFHLINNNITWVDEANLQTNLYILYFRATFESYPRGQLKPLRDSNKVAQEPSSSALRSAIRSKNVYKRQHVQEQRLRPIDTSSSNYVDLNNDRTHYVNPYRLFVKSN